MDKSPLILVREFCGEPPHVLAKSEAIALLNKLVRMPEFGKVDITLDFAGIDGVSASGARVLMHAILTSEFPEPLSRFIWKGLAEGPLERLEEAASDLLAQSQQKQ